MGPAEPQIATRDVQVVGAPEPDIPVAMFQAVGALEPQITACDVQVVGAPEPEIPLSDWILTCAPQCVAGSGAGPVTLDLC